MAKSYYTILGVTRNASADEIRSAYRRLAKEYHPDRYAGDSTVFRQVQEAYAVLGNAGRRARYEDETSRRPTGRVRDLDAEPLIPDRAPEDIETIPPLRSYQRITPSFDELFDWLWGNFAAQGRPIRAESGRARNLTIEVPLSRQQARSGGNARVLVPARLECPSCRGYGAVGPYECPRCAGQGAVSGEVPVSVAFPARLTRAHAVMIPLERFGIRNLRLTVMFQPTQVEEL